MSLSWPMDPTVEASDFDPFTKKEVAMPVQVQTVSMRPRAALKSGTVTRPVRRNFLELGLVCGDGAHDLEARAALADAAERQADRAAGAGRGQSDEAAGAGEVG